MTASSFLRSFRIRAQARNELDRLSTRQLRDLNLERVEVTPGASIYQNRMWNGV